jgi:carboxyl-terminal processing protease
MLTKPIKLILTIAALCISVALVLLGNLYSGGALVIFVIVAAGLSQCSRFNELTLSSLRGFAIALTSAAVGAGLILLVAAVGYVPGFGSAIARPAVTASSDYRALELFGKVFDIVRADYVDRPDDAKLIASALQGMLSGLDPHSSYMDAKHFRDMQVDTNGQFGGLGMEVTLSGGLIKVVSPIDNTPASKAGILAGDVITQVDDQPVKGIALDRVVAKLRGPVGSQVRLEISRKSDPNPIHVTLTRETIKIQSVKDHAEGNDVGYVRITQFNDLTTDELKAALKNLAKRLAEPKVKGYILDLRNNPGGLLDQAVSVSDAFLNQGEIVSIRGRAPDESQRFDAKPGDLIHGKPLIVLINGGTASAAEIVSGALQDHKRATILGTRSFGKGSVQTIIPLGPGNGALRLTTARYYTPSGRSIQAQGITPDIEVAEQVPKNIAAHMSSISEADLRGHLKATGAEEKGSQSYVPSDEKDDRALQTAIALLRGTKTNPVFPPNATQARAN